MTPKEKAEDLIHKFYLSLPNNGSQTGINNIHDRWSEGKNCALIAVNEMIKIAPWGGDDENPDEGSKEFYFKVKEQIEKYK